MRRIREHPILSVRVKEKVEITVDNRKIHVQKGDNLAAALMSAGVDVFRYTPKRREPRGIFCGIGQCNDCVMVVDGVPDVRTCATRVRKGMVVKTQQGKGHIQ